MFDCPSVMNAKLQLAGFPLLETAHKYLSIQIHWPQECDSGQLASSFASVQCS
jgi:hypothetical protein